MKTTNDDNNNKGANTNDDMLIPITILFIMIIAILF